ncbi:MAG: ACP S-malonyltransferase [Leptolyngbyaceae bacterium]|nr:ACP S-malonyltransferase [Leptolyngbyaceae bacterium]
MTKTAWVFPGQGSQSVGMGADLAAIESASKRLETASEVLGWSVLDVCQSDEEKVSNTLYTQPCLYVIESILVDLLGDRTEQPALVAGHSLGEYVALYAARVFDFEAGLRLVKRRAELMSEASDGMMAALMGFDRDELDTLLEKTEGVVLANDNNSGQVVVSGTPDAVQSLMESIKAKRKVPLKVSGAFHSPLMAEAAQDFGAVLEAVDFKTATIPVMSNVDPTPETNADQLKERLKQQMTGSVRWREISLRLPEEGIDTVIEVGPGNVLTGLIKRTCSGLTLKNVKSSADLPA